MADTIQQLVDDVRLEGSFDVTAAQALRWLTRRHRTMVADSMCFRKSVDVGPTVAGVREYGLPLDVVQLLEVSVGGTVYGGGWHRDLSDPLLTLRGAGGFVAAEETTDGTSTLAVYPTPATGGDTIEVRAVFMPPDLVIGDETTLKIPGDATDALVAGAIATGLRRVESRPDLAEPHEGEFQAGVQRLRAQTARRYRGPGPVQIRVVGLNA